MLQNEVSLILLKTLTIQKNFDLSLQNPFFVPRMNHSLWTVFNQAI